MDSNLKHWQKLLTKKAGHLWAGVQKLPPRIKSTWTTLRTTPWNKENLITHGGALLEWLQSGAKHLLQQKAFPIYGKAATIAVCAYFLSDLSALLIERFIPPPPIPKTVERTSTPQQRKTLQSLEGIFGRNLFNSKGLIPGENTEQAPDSNAPATRSNLPINLVGTMVLQDPNRSLATLEDKSTSLVLPVRVGDEIPNQLRVLSVETRRVTFQNLQNGRKEFIELPDDFIPPTPTRSAAAPTQPSKVQSAGTNRFVINRGEIDTALAPANFNKILTQARAVPNFENGLPAGYKLFQIVPGSIYDQLGLKNGDIISGVNGEPINDPGKAFELLGELKNSNHLDLTIKREGRDQAMSYDIQ